MKKEIVKAMEDFSIRVLQGGVEVSPQETAILPGVLEILQDVTAGEEWRDKDEYVYERKNSNKDN